MPLIKNDFEDVLLEDYSELAYIKEAILAAGAEASQVSGSGASVFGIFSDESIAKQAKTLFPHRSPLQTTTTTISPGQLSWHL